MIPRPSAYPHSLITGTSLHGSSQVNSLPSSWCSKRSSPNRGCRRVAPASLLPGVNILALLGSRLTAPRSRGHSAFQIPHSAFDSYSRTFVHPYTRTLLADPPRSPRRTPAGPRTAPRSWPRHPPPPACGQSPAAPAHPAPATGPPRTAPFASAHCRARACSRGGQRRPRPTR